MLSLAQAKESAFEKNWDLLAAKSGIDAATAQLIVAKEFPNPTASLAPRKSALHERRHVHGQQPVASQLRYHFCGQSID